VEERREELLLFNQDIKQTPNGASANSNQRNHLFAARTPKPNKPNVLHARGQREKEREKKAKKKDAFLLAICLY
jgi:hypothetical protein